MDTFSNDEFQEELDNDDRDEIDIYEYNQQKNC